MNTPKKLPDECTGRYYCGWPNECECAFVCNDCKRELPGKERCDPDLDVCKACLGKYENVSGYCSPYCRVSGKCDYSC